MFPFQSATPPVCFLEEEGLRFEESARNLGSLWRLSAVPLSQDSATAWIGVD